MLTIAWIRLKLLKNKTSIVWMLIAPILFITLIVYGFEGTDTKTQIMVVDNANSQLSQEFIEILSEDTEYTYESSDMVHAKKALVDGSSIAIIVIPENYSAMMANGGDKEYFSLIKLRDNSRIAAVENNITNCFNHQRFYNNIGKIAQKGIEDIGVVLEDNKLAIDIQNQFQKNSSHVNTKVVNNSQIEANEDSLPYSTIGIMVMFIMFFVVNSAGVLVDERTNGILERIKAAQTNKLKIAAGQSIGLVIMGLIQVLILVVFGHFAYGINWGKSYVGLILLSFCYVLSCASFGTLISTFAKNRKQFIGFMSIAVVSTSLLGGCMWSADMLSGQMAIVAKFMPQNWAIEGLANMVVRGNNATGVFMPCVMLCMFSVIFFLLTYFRVKITNDKRI